MQTRFMALAALAFLSACTSYYMVHDTASNKTYYTTSVDEAGKNGAIKFKDAVTGSSVTLQSSDVKQISSDEFHAATAQK
jgi:hypothetical protein